MRKEDIEYLALEGGGGKGVTYLGAVVALEDCGVLPISKKMNQTEIIQKEKRVVLTERHRQIRGISGSSAGAITGLCLAMGMNSDELVDLLTEKTTVWGKRQNMYNSFFDYPFDSENYRAINSGKVVFSSNGNPTTSYKDHESIVFQSRVINDVDGSTQEAHFTSAERNIFKGQGIWGILKGGLKNYIPVKDSLIAAMFGFPKLTYGGAERDDFKFDIHLKGFFNMGGLFAGMIPRDFIRYLIQKNLRNIENFDQKVNDYNNSIWIKNEKESLEFANEHGEESEEFRAEIKAINKPYFYSYIHKNSMYNLTFEQFYFLTGVDFVVTGTNITNNASLYFSKDRTPDFPVADAVLISMNLPGIYSPVWNKAKVFQDQNQFYIRYKKTNKKSDISNKEYRAYNNMYKGQYIDGGVMNNLPLHAFDHIEHKGDDVNDEEIFKYYIDPREPLRNTRFNRHVLGLRLTEVSTHIDGEVDKEKDFGLSVLGKTLFSALYYSEDGKILSKTERDACINLSVFSLSTTNFAPSQSEVSAPIKSAYTSTYKFVNKRTVYAPKKLGLMIEKWDK